MTELLQAKKKKKITLTHIGIMALVIIAAANFYMWRANAAGKASALEITGNTAGTRQQLAQLAEPPSTSELESRLTEVEAELKAIQAGVPVMADPNEVINYILGIADKYHVQILPLVSDGWSVKNIGQTYHVLSLTITAEGSLENVKDLMTTLQTDRYPSLALAECNIERTFTDDGIPPAEKNISVRASLRLEIYTSGLEEGTGL